MNLTSIGSSKGHVQTPPPNKRKESWAGEGDEPEVKKEQGSGPHKRVDKPADQAADPGVAALEAFANEDGKAVYFVEERTPVNQTSTRNAAAGSKFSLGAARNALSKLQQ